MVDFLEIARTMKRRNYSEREFSDLFGTSSAVVGVVWWTLQQQDLLHPRAAPKHLLWVLHWYKAYPLQSDICDWCGGISHHTWIQWRDRMQLSLRSLAVVSLPYCSNVDSLPTTLLSNTDSMGGQVHWLAWKSGTRHG